MFGFNQFLVSKLLHKYVKVMANKPQRLLNGMAIDMVDLAEKKTLPYEKFIEEVLEFSNSIASDQDQITYDYFNQYIYTENKIVINMNSSGERTILYRE
jgi:hypothetical protein